MNNFAQPPIMDTKRLHVFRRLQAQHVALSLLLRQKPVPPQLLLAVGLSTADYNPEVPVNYAMYVVCVVN